MQINMKYTILNLLVLLLFASDPAWSQETLTLEEAIEKGLANSFLLKSAEEGVAIAQNQNNWAEAGKLPNVNATLGFNNSFLFQENPASVLLEQTNLNNSLNPGINLSWMLYNGKRIQFTKEQLQQLEYQSNLSAQAMVETLVQQISLAYYQTILQQKQLAVFEKVLGLSKDRIRYEQAKQEFGQSVTFDLLQTQDAYLSDSANFVLQLNNLETAHRNLNLSMQEKDLSKRYVLIDTMEVTTEVYDFAQLEDDLLAQNNDLQLQRLARELAQINTRIQEANRKPMVSLGSGLSYNASLANGEQKFSFSPEPQTINGARANAFNAFINISASYPIYDGGIRKRAVENAVKQELIAQYATENLKQQLQSQLANTLAGYNTQKQQVDLAVNRMDKAAQNLAIAAERFRGGLISSFDYRTIQLNFVNAGQNLAIARFNLKSTEIELQRLTGRIAPQRY